jgi:hypothetical protein
MKSRSVKISIASIVIYSTFLTGCNDLHQSSNDNAAMLTVPDENGAHLRDTIHTYEKEALKEAHPKNQ